MYKVIEVAEALGVSKVTVYKKITTLSKEIKPFIFKKKGITYIEAGGVELIKQSLEVSTLIQDDTNNVYNAEVAFTVEEDIPDGVSILTDKLNTLQEDYISSLKEQIGLLKEELNEKNNQLNNKDKLLENFQVLLKDTNKKVMLLEEEKKELQESKNFFSFFKFNRK
jgi:hypothetical protein